MKKQQMIIIILGLALFISVQYIILQQWVVMNNEQLNTNFQEGYNLGLEEAITALFKNTDDCNIATISFENSSRAFADVNCKIEFEDFQN